MNSFNFNLSGKHFICPSILNDSFAGQSNLGCRSLLFITLNTSCESLLACKVSFEKPADSLIGMPLQVTTYFSLAVFKILSLTFGLIIMMCLGMFFFGFILFGALCASWIVCLFSSPNQGSFLSLFFQVSFQFLALSLLLAPL